MNVLRWLGFLAAVGCGDSSPATVPTATAPHVPTKQAQPPQRPPPPSPARTRVVRVTGSPQFVRDGSPVRTADDLHGHGTIALSQNDSLVFDFADGGRIDARAPARGCHLWVGAETAAQVFAIRCDVRGLVVPEATSDRPPLRIATPDATAEILSSGEVWVSSLPSGATWLAALGGAVSVWVQGHGEAVLLPAGRALLVAETVAEPTAGPMDVRGAEQMTAELRTAAPARSSLTERMTTAGERLDGALSEARRGQETTSSLRALHLLAVQSHSPEARDLQTRIVRQSQALVGQRRAVLIEWERFSALSCGPGRLNDCAEIRPDVAAALGLGNPTGS